MAMTIMNDASAAMTLGELNKNISQLGKQLKKVSSGQRINGAGDAPSEYSISEKMRVRIRALDQDERNVLNGAALLRTAEGAIQLAIENTDFTLWKSRVLIVGYGRVGKVLACRLHALGCEVTVSARKESDLAFAQSLGYRVIKTKDLSEALPYCDIVFNTVDAPVIDDNMLEISAAKLMVDLSSKGGFDLESATKKGIVAFKAPGLPGKIAPVTAGKILAKIVFDILMNQ